MSERRVNFRIVAFAQAALSTWNVFLVLVSTRRKLFSKALLKYYLLQGSSP
jgi:hypothetical protein